MTSFTSTARFALFAGLVSGCVALTAFTSTPAFAADENVLPQAAFSVRGVDFTSPPAVAHLKRQLTRVATDICFPDAHSHLLMNADEHTCYATALKDGLAQIDSRAQQAMRDRAVRLADARATGNPVN